MGEDNNSHKLEDLRKSFSTTLLVLILIFAGFLFLSFPLGSYAFYNGNLSTSSAEPIIRDIPVFVVGLPIELPARMTFSDLFAVLWIIHLIFFVIAINGPYSSLWQVIKKLPKGGIVRMYDNGVTSMVATFTSVALVTSIIERFQTTVGIASGSLPETDPIQTFTGIALAPLTEEIGFRVSTIGLIAFTMLLGRYQLRYALKAFWHPGRYLNYPSNRGNRSMYTIYAVAIISGILFGLAHILFGAGWQVGKFTTSSIAGIMLGILYIRVGLPAAVLMHWAFNYFRSSYYYFGQVIDGVMVQQGMEVLLVVIGAMSLGYAILTRAATKSSTFDAG